MTERMEPASRPRPRVFRMSPTAPEAAVPFAPAEAPLVEWQEDAFAREAERDGPSPDRRGGRRGRAGARHGAPRAARAGARCSGRPSGGLVSLAFSLWVSRLIEDLFARTMVLGWFGVGLLVLLGLAILALAVREAVGVFRQAKVARLHQALAAARLADDRDAARRLMVEVAALYAARPETTRGRAEIARAATEIVDGRDLIDIAEAALLLPIDRIVASEIAGAAKRVSLVTAISPRAVIDLVFVAGQIVWLIRRIAELYSGRPGLFGFLRLARSVGAHLAVTGGMAVGDSLVQQVVGHGIAAKLSARLGEGVLNGMLTTRVGLSAMAVCRPMPFAVGKPPGVKDVAPFLFRSES